MANIDSGGHGGGGKKSVDQEVPLVPFIDLLLCCVMFLLVTAVWNKLARINANQNTPGLAEPTDAPPPEDTVKLYLQVQNTGYVLASTAGDRIPITKNGEEYDIATLQTKLQERHAMESDRTDIIVAPEDGVLYHHVIEAMDIAVGEGYSDVSLSDGASML